MHEAAELGLSDERIGIATMDEERQLAAVEGVEREEVRLAEGFEVGFVSYESFSPCAREDGIELHCRSSLELRALPFESMEFFISTLVKRFIIFNLSL